MITQAPTTTFEEIENRFETGYQLLISHTHRRASLFRSRDGQSRVLDYGQVLALLPRLKKQYAEKIQESGQQPEDTLRPMNEGGGAEAALRMAPPPPSAVLSQAKAEAAPGADPETKAEPEAKPIVLDRPYYTARELAAVTGIDSNRFKALHRYVESRPGKDAREYRTGKALAEKVKKYGFDLQVELLPAYQDVEGKVAESQKTNSKPKSKAKGSSAAARKAAKSKPTKKPSLPAQKNEVATEAAAASPAAPVDGVGIGEPLVLHVPAQVPEVVPGQGDGSLDGSPGRLSHHVESKLYRAEALAGLLHRRLLDAERVVPADFYLAEVVHQDLTGVLATVAEEARAAVLGTPPS